MVELRHLFGLIAAVLTPMVVCLGTFLVFLDRGADLHAGLELRSAAREVAAQAAAAVGRDIAALTTLASAAALDTADHAAFRAQAERALGNGLGWLGIILADDSRQIVNTRVTGSEELPPLHLPSDIWRVLQAGRPDLSPVLADRYRFGQPLVAVRVPVVRSGVARYVLIALVPASRFAELLQAQMRGSADRAPGGLLVIDQRDRIVARRGIFSGPEMEVGMPAPAALLGVADEHGVFTAGLPGDRTVHAARAELAPHGWRVVLAAAEHPLSDRFMETPPGAAPATLATLAAGIALLVSLAAGWAVSGRIRARAALRPALAAERRLAEIAAHIPGLIYRRTEFPDGTSRYDFRAGGLSGEIRDLPEMPVGSFGESQSPVCFEQEVVMSDGSRRWLRCVAAPMSLPDGAVVWDGLALDVTDLRQVEAALRDSESRLRLAQEAAGITTWDWDLESGRIVWSRAITGLPPLPDSAVDQPQVLDPLALARHFTTPCDRETALETVAHAMREEADLDFRCRLDQPDGSRRWLICLGRSIAGQQGRPARMIGILRDITPYLEAQEALRAAKTALELEVSGRRRTEAVLETLYATAPTGLCVVDPDLRLRHINQRFAALGTLPPHAYLGRKLGEALPAPLAAVLEPLCRRMMETGLPVQDQEAVARLPDGTGPERHWLVSLHPLRHPDGTLGAINLMLQDITESKAMEATLRLALEESRLAIAAKAKFFAAASHDLRQPVQTLFLFAHALHERLRDHPAQALVATMQQALEGMKSLIDTLLDISRLDSGAVEPKVTEFPLIALLQRLQADYEPRMAAKGLRLRLVGSQAWVRSDTLLLGRILGNLLENALKYTDRGEVLIGCRHRGGQLRIEVWDTGCGIPEDKQAAIFEEFVQLGDRPPTAAEGLGLGLSIVQRLARLLGHELGVRSRPGRGSVFSIAVPRAGSAVEAPQRPPLLIAGGTADRPLAVVIDDDTTILTALGILLDEWGWEVLTAETAPEAMGAIAGSRRRPDLIIADYTLDGPATGTDVVRDIRSYCNFPVPAIVLTGDTKPERALEVGRIGSHLLVKPVTPETLHELIRRLAAGG